MMASCAPQILFWLESISFTIYSVEDIGSIISMYSSQMNNVHSIYRRELGIVVSFEYLLGNCNHLMCLDV